MAPRKILIKSPVLRRFGIVVAFLSSTVYQFYFSFTERYHGGQRALIIASNIRIAITRPSLSVSRPAVHPVV